NLAVFHGAPHRRFVDCGEHSAGREVSRGMSCLAKRIFRSGRVQLAGFGGLAQQFGRLEDLLAGAGVPVVEPLDDLAKTFEARPEHRATLADGEAVAVDPDDIDVGSSRCDTLLEDLR